MDYPTPTEHRHRPRRRRLTLTITSALILAVMILVGANGPSQPGQKSAGTTSPSPTNQSNPLASAVNSAAQAAGTATQTVINDQPGLWHVSRDIDGDTIVVTQGSDTETVRFIGMDTPETHDPCKPVQCYGPEAAAHTKALLKDQNVRLAADPEDSDRDKYGRLLRYIYLPNGELVNAELVQDGYAFAYVVFPFSKLDQFTALEYQAHAAGRGLWSACNVDSSDIIKQTAGPKS